MTRKLHLMSGHSSDGDLKELDKRALADAPNKNILILNMSGDNPEKLQYKGDFLKEYFQEIGTRNIELGRPEDNDIEIIEKMNESGLVYLPGGNTGALIKNIKEKGLVSKLKSFNGVISGNSAGTYAMCPDYLRIGRGEPEIIPSLGFVNFWTKAHYEPKFDSDLKKLSANRIIYGLENGSAIISSDKLEFVGNIWKFSEGKKEKVNESPNIPKKHKSL